MKGQPGENKSLYSETELISYPHKPHHTEPTSPKEVGGSKVVGGGALRTLAAFCLMIPSSFMYIYVYVYLYIHVDIHIHYMFVPELGLPRKVLIPTLKQGQRNPPPRVPP